MYNISFFVKFYHLYPAWCYISASNACRGQGWLPFNYSCYLVKSRLQGDYEEANLSCKQFGAHLATFDNVKEDHMDILGKTCNIINVRN